jgi:hypothetical protein
MITLGGVAALLVITACASRYRLDLRMTLEEYTSKVKIQNSWMVFEVVIDDTKSPDKLRPGLGTVAALSIEGRWRRQDASQYPVLRFDENLQGLLYLQLPTPLATGEVQLTDSSLITLLGRYDQPPEAKLFRPTAGFYRIDSLTSDRAFLTVKGEYSNSQGVPLTLIGSLKLNLAD